MARRLSIGRLRGGELLAGVGAVVLFVSLFLPWFGLDFAGWSDWVRAHADEIPGWTAYLPGGPYEWDAWTLLGWFALAIATLAVACAAWLIVVTAVARPVTHIVAAAVLTATIAPVALVLLALRALVFQPGANEVTTVEYGAWIGLAGAVLLVIGAWSSLADERTGMPENVQEPPPPRPAPPPRSS
jgi:hypothetical protein